MPLNNSTLNSGLNADKLDGYDYDAFAWKDHDHNRILPTRHDSGHPAPNATYGLTFQFSYFDSNWWNVLNMRSYSDNNYSSTQLLTKANNPGSDTYSGDSMYWRQGRNGTWNTIKCLLDSSNYTGYLGYIGTTAVQASSAAQALTGITAFTFNGASSAGTNYITGSAGRIFFGGNFHIDSLGSYSTYINHYTANNVYLVSGSSQGNVGIGTTAPTYKLDISGKTRSTDRIYSNEWIQFDNATGLYWPNHYGSHFYVNTSYTTYGNFVILGSKNSYAGINFGGSTSRMTLMDAGNDKGAYQENWGWLWYFNGANGKMHLRTSSNLGYDINLNGSVGSNSSFSGVGFVHTSYNSASYLLTSNGGVVNEGKYFKVAQAEPYGKSDYPWHLVAEFTQDNSLSQINTGIILLVKRFYSGTGAGILSIRCRYESGGSTPSFLHCNWILNDDLDSNSFVATCKRSGNIVTLRLYAYHVGWGIYTFQKLNESGWNMWENTWSLYNAHRGQSDYASYCFTTIPSGETQYVSTILTINNPVPWSGINGKPFNWSGQSGQPTWLWGSNDGTNYYVWNPSNFSVNYANSAGSASSSTYTRYLTCPDTRSSAPAPGDYTATSTGVSFDFKQSSVTGLGGYSGVMTVRSYASGQDWSGGPVHQIAFYAGGGLYHRIGTSSWGSWETIITSSNISTYAPSTSIDYTIWRDISSSVDYKIQVVSSLPSSTNSNTFYIVV